MASEPVIVLLVQDNLDIACSAIEKAAMERAVSDVDEGFAASYEARRRHREVRKCFLLRILSDHSTDSHRPELLGSHCCAVHFRSDPS